MQSPFSALFVVGAASYKVLTCEYLFYQNTDVLGNAVARVRSGEIELLLEGDADTLLLGWAADPLRQLSGEIVFFQGNQLLGMAEKLGFTAGSCVSYTEVLEPANAVGSYLYQVKIVANLLNLNGLEHSNEWPTYG